MLMRVFGFEGNGLPAEVKVDLSEIVQMTDRVPRLASECIHPMLNSEGQSHGHL